MAEAVETQIPLVRAGGGVVWRPGPQGGPEVLVVHRPKYDDWSLPKGKRDPGESDEECALREVEEEIGVAREHVEVFGRFGDRTTRSRFLMTSFVGAITHPAPYAFQIAGHEVDELLEVPLRHLLDPISIEIAQTESGQEMRSFRFGEHLIYGVTARVLSDFLDIVAAEVAAEIEVALTPEAPRP